MSTAPKEEVIQYLDQMDEGSVIRVLMYVKSLSDQKKNKKSPYGKFKTAEEYAQAQKMWSEFEELCQPSSISEEYDYKKAAREARRRKYESLS